jgi:hypothetical protein
MHQTCRRPHLTLAHCFFSCNHACERIFVIPEGRAIYPAVVEKKKELLAGRCWIGLVQDIRMDNMRHAPFQSRIIVYNLHLVEFNFFSQIEKTKRIATNAMRVSWTEVSAIDAFSRRFVESIFKNPYVVLLVDGRWEMRDKDGARVGK